MSECFIVKKFVIGTESWELPASQTETHGWRIYIREDGQPSAYENDISEQNSEQNNIKGNDREEPQNTLSNEQITHRDQNIPLWIDRVELFLHETFIDPHRILAPPFELEEKGWGEFVILIHIFIREKRFEFHHKLILFSDQIKDNQATDKTQKKSLKRHKKNINDEEFPGGSLRRATRDKKNDKKTDTNSENNEKEHEKSHIKNETDTGGVSDKRKYHRKRSLKSDKKTEIKTDKDLEFQYDKDIESNRKQDLESNEKKDLESEEKMDIVFSENKEHNPNEKKDSESEKKKDIESDEKKHSESNQKKKTKKDSKKESKSEEKKQRTSTRRSSERSDQKSSYKTDSHMVRVVYRDKKQFLISERVETFVFYIHELQNHVHRRKLNQKDKILLSNILPGVQEESDSETELIDRAIEWVVKEIEKE